MGSLALGSHNPAFGAGSYWDGPMAEILLYSRLLSSSEKARLRTYLNARYLLGVT